MEVAGLDFEQVWRRARGAVRDVASRLRVAHRDYVASWPHDESLVEEADRIYRALDWKLIPISFHLETLLGLVEMKDEHSFMLHGSEAAASEWAILEHDIGLLTLESVLFQFRAFLDLHMCYSLLLLGEGPDLNMKRRRFRKALERLAGSPPADALGAYYRDQVWAHGRWGNLLVSLRDKIAHSDRLSTQVILLKTLGSACRYPR